VLVWAAMTLLPMGNAFAGQGAVRMLYTSPNMKFVEKTSGEVIISINDSSGSISTLQTAINAARASNPTNVIVIRLTNTTYVVSSAGIVLGSHECLVASGATIRAADASVTVPLVTIASGSINVSVSGGTFDGNGANIQGIYAPAAARVNIDKVVVASCGQDGILLKGNGNSTYDNEMTVTRCDASGSAAHAGISIQNCTQAAVLDNNCHNNSAGIYISCAWATVANNTCATNATGIDIAGGNDNVVANNTCNNNGTGIRAGASNNMLVSNATGDNSTAGINSNGSGNTFVDNLFTSGNTANFTSAGSGNRVVAYKTPLNATGQDYFYPPLIDDQHANAIVNGMGRTDLTIGTTTIASVQSQYDAARAANPNNVIVLHLNGTFTVGSAPLSLASNTCVLLNGTIQINASTTASSAISDNNAPRHVSMSGGIIDGGNLTGNNGIQFSSSSMLQVDNMTLRNFGPANPRSGGSDVIHFDHGSLPYIVTRCIINGSSSRAIWLQLSGVKSVMSDNDISNVNQDGVDCDSSTSGCVAKFNYCHDLVRYGVFFEQSATHNLALGNICNNDGRDINVYNNSTTPRGDTAFNSILCNSLLGNNGLRNGSTGTNVVQSSHNFFFNNTVINASIASETYGTQNYYSQNYQTGGSLSTAGVEVFFNSTDVSSNLFLQDGASGLATQAQGASTNSSAPIVIGTPGALGNDQWQLVPTDSGFFRIMNQKSHLAMAVTGASTNPGALIIQFAFGSAKNDQWMPRPAGNGLYYFVNRLSGLCLDVPGGVSGTQLDQRAYTNGANQQFSLNLAATQLPSAFTLAATPGSAVVTVGGATNYTVTLTTNADFSGPVFFSLTGLPANAMANFVPLSLSGPGATTCNIVTATNTPAGSYTMTVLGTNGSGDSNTVAVSLTVNAPGSNLVWNSSSSTAWDTSTPNWFNEVTGLNEIFQTGKNVVFEDRAGVTPGVTLATGVAVSPASVTVNAEAVNYTISGAGKISGTTGLTKNGNSTLAVNTTNDFTGPTTISGGVLSAALLANGGVASGIGAAGTSATNLVLDGGTLRWIGAASASVNRGMTFMVNGGTLDSSPPVSANLTLSGTAAFSGSGARTLVLAGVDPNPLLIGGNGLSSVIADGAGGATTIEKDGNNAWNLSGNNTYSGGTVVSGGRLRANTSANAFGTGPVTVASGGQAYLNVGSTFPNAFIIAGMGIPETEGNYGALRLAANGATVTNVITLTDDARITARGASAAGAVISGQITGDSAVEFGNSGGGAGVLTLSNVNNNWSGDTTISHGTVRLGAAGVIPHGVGNGNVIVNGSTNTLDSLFDLNGTRTVVNGLFSAGDLTRVIVTNSSVTAAVLVVGDNDANGEFDGMIRNGAGGVALTKIGLGAEILGGANTYTGATVISNGVLIVNGSVASAAVSVMTGAALGGNGVISGATVVNPGGMISPGNSIGALTINGAVTLNGATFVELNQALGTNDVLRSANNIAYGGVLILTNAGGTLTTSDSFKIFDAGGYSGAFTNIVPAIPGVGLAWNTNTLASDGRLTIVAAATPQPQISSLLISASGLTISGSNGVPDWPYLVLSSTNLTVPAGNWSVNATNVFDSNGNFIFTNPIEAGAPQIFYMLRLP
jgi:autotransporter-associated beta strand protein/parallel beta-helix repeat protein